MNVARRLGAAVLAAALVVGVLPGSRPVLAADPMPGERAGTAAERVPDPVTFVPEARREEINRRPEATIGFRSRTLLAPRRAPAVEARANADPAPEWPLISIPRPTRTPAAPPVTTVVEPALPEPEPTTDPSGVPPKQPALVASTPLAPAAGEPRVMGVIRGPGDVPLAGMKVCLDDASGHPLCLRIGTTDAGGAYAIEAPPGSYNVRSFDQDGLYVGAYWSPGGSVQRQNLAGVVTVSTTDVTGIDITVPLFPYIRGTLRNADGDPLEGRRIEGASYSSSVTAADGSFAVKVYPHSQSTILVGPTAVYRGGWYSTAGFVTDVALATTIDVADSDVTGIDIVNPTWPRITGHVTDVNGDPAASLFIQFFRDGTGTRTEATTDSNGRYQAYAIGGGTWKGWFGYAAPWIGQTARVTADTDATLDVVLHRLPVISGQVVGPDGTPLAGIRVDFSSWQDSVEATTDADGRFSITWIYMGDPRVFVFFWDPTGTYAGGSLGLDGYVPSGAPAVYFTMDPDEVLDASVTLPAYVYLTGNVRLADGSPVSGGWVAARAPDTWNDVSIEVDGSFSIKLLPGSYSLVVPGGFYGREGFAYETGAVEPFAVGEAGRDIDVVLPADHEISGRVTTGAAGIGGIEVDLFLEGLPFSSTLTEPDGTWSIAVPPGAYIVGFYDAANTYAHGWYGAAGYTSDPLAAALVGLGTADTGGIDVSLPVTRRISGKVVVATFGNAVPYAYVEAFVNGVFYSSAYASSAGAYNLPVAPGKVTLWMYDTDLRYAPGWRASTNLTANWASAAVTTVGASNVSGVTIRTVEADLLRMSVTFSPVPNSWASSDARVEAVVNGAAVSFDLIDSQLNHIMPVLKGSYRLWVDADNTAYHQTDGWYTSAGSLTPDAAGAAVKVVAGISNFAINIPVGTDITGNVRDKDGYPVSGIGVQLFANTSAYVDTVTDAGGWFSIVAPPGTYRLGVFDTFGLYRSGWLGPSGFVADYASARNLTVTSSTGITGLTINLPMRDPPAPPSNVVATPYNESVEVSFTPSVGSLALPIIHHAVTASPGGRQCIAVSTASCTVTGLSNGTPYTFSVTASSMAGAGSASLPSIAVAPAPVPNAPGGLAVTRSGSSLVLSWSAPSGNGSAVIGYLAGVSPGGRTCTPAPPTATTCTITGLADGRYTVSVTAANSFGAGPRSSAAVVMDATAPLVTAPSTSLRSGLTMSGTSVPVNVAWTATDALTGVTGTTLNLLLAPRLFRVERLATRTSTTHQRVLPARSDPYQFRARAQDGSGNASAWSSGPWISVSLSQETGSGIAYSGTWGSTSSASALGGSVRSTTAKGAAVTVTFTGRGVSFISRKGATSGKAAIYVDGVLKTTLDLHASSSTDRWIAYAATFSSTGKHTLKIVNQATSGQPRLYVDGFAIIR